MRRNLRQLNADQLREERGWCLIEIGFVVGAISFLAIEAMAPALICFGVFGVLMIRPSRPTL